MSSPDKLVAPQTYPSFRVTCALPCEANLYRRLSPKQDAFLTMILKINLEHAQSVYIIRLLSRCVYVVHMFTIILHYVLDTVCDNMSMGH